MYLDANQNAYFQYLYNIVSTSAEQIALLESTIEQLKSEITQMKSEPKIHIEKLEYHFDQLKVEKLEGTLNFGFSPNTLPDKIEEFNVNGKEITDPTSQDTNQMEQYQRIFDQITHYLNIQLPQELSLLEQKYNLQRDPDYHTFIIEDMKKQLGPRIQHYLLQMKSHLPPGNSRTIEQSILERVKQDIRIAIENYLKNASRKDER